MLKKKGKASEGILLEHSYKIDGKDKVRYVQGVLNGSLQILRFKKVKKITDVLFLGVLKDTETEVAILDSGAVCFITPKFVVTEQENATYYVLKRNQNTWKGSPVVRVVDSKKYEVADLTTINEKYFHCCRQMLFIGKGDTLVAHPMSISSVTKLGNNTLINAFEEMQQKIYLINSMGTLNSLPTDLKVTKTSVLAQDKDYVIVSDGVYQVLAFRNFTVVASSIQNVREFYVYDRTEAIPFYYYTGEKNDRPYWGFNGAFVPIESFIIYNNEAYRYDSKNKRVIKLYKQDVDDLNRKFSLKYKDMTNHLREEENQEFHTSIVSPTEALELQESCKFTSKTVVQDKAGLLAVMTNLFTIDRDDKAISVRHKLTVENASGFVSSSEQNLTGLQGIHLSGNVLCFGINDEFYVYRNGLSKFINTLLYPAALNNEIVISLTKDKSKFIVSSSVAANPTSVPCLFADKIILCPNSIVVCNKDNKQALRVGTNFEIGKVSSGSVLSAYATYSPSDWIKCYDKQLPLLIY